MSFNLLLVNFFAFLLPATLGAFFVQALDIRREGKNIEIGFIKAAVLASLVTAAIVIIFSIEFVPGLVIGFIFGIIFELVRDIYDEKKSMPYRIAQVKKSQRK